MAYIGTQPKDVRSFRRAKFDFTATQGQTAFTGADDDSKTLGFTDGQIEVYVNGILMDESDFTTSNGNTVTLASAANLNDIISIISLQTDIPNSDFVPKTGGTFSGNVTNSGNVTVGGTLGVTGAVTAANGLTVDDDGATPLTVDRATSDGTIIDVQKDGTSIGNIGTSGGDLLMYSTEASHGGLRFGEGYVFPVNNSGATSDAGFDLGLSVGRFKDLYLSGGVYIGGTIPANLLDDYEVGNWTPTVHQGGYGLNVSMARYTKIGRQVTVLTDLSLTGSGNSSDLIIGGLPFTNSYLGYASGAGYTQVWPGGNHFTPTVGASGTLVRFMTGAGAYYDANQFSTGYLNFTITYFV